MAKVTHESLERLRERKERLEAKLKRLRHQQRYQNRKEDARRKFIVEAAVAGGDMEPEFLERVLNQYVTKARERKFMELDPPPETRNKRDA